jgi:hypothetical protein
MIFSETGFHAQDRALAAMIAPTARGCKRAGAGME